MGGLLSPLQRLGVRRKVEQLLATNRVSLHWPEKTPCPACGYNPLTAVSLDVNCPACQGSGFVRTWRQAILRVRVAWIDHQRFGFQTQGFTSGELGDVELQARLTDQAAFERVAAEPEAYILVDGARLRPYSITRNRVEGVSSLDVRCKVANTGRLENS